jgi:hypothetical protein
MSVEFDSRSWPLLLVRIVGRDTDESVQEMLDGFFHHLSRSRCAVVIDTTDLIYPPLHDAQRWARQEGNWLRQHRNLVERNSCGVGFVITNPAVRFLLSGILLIAPLPCDHVVVSTALEARAFCESRLRLNHAYGSEGLGRPSAMRPTAMPIRTSKGRSKTAS